MSRRTGVGRDVRSAHEECTLLGILSMAGVVARRQTPSCPSRASDGGRAARRPVYTLAPKRHSAFRSRTEVSGVVQRKEKEREVKRTSLRRAVSYHFDQVAC